VAVNVSVGRSHGPIRPIVADTGLDPALQYSGYDCVSRKTRDIQPRERAPNLEREMGITAAHDRHVKGL